MGIKFFCPRWGSEHINWEIFCKKVKDSGYDGIEYAIPGNVDRNEIDEAWDSMNKYGLLIIAQHYDTIDSSYPQHYEKYGIWLEKMKNYPCLKINSHTGKDFFTFEQNKSLIEMATTFSEKYKIDILHETHRGNFSFAPHITHQFINAIPSIKITLDISHWVNVSASYLEDQQEAMMCAISHTAHIHARIGFPEGPQINDPRAPEWNDTTNKHLAWWDRVIENKNKYRRSFLTITPEFGPYPYMPQQPFTRKDLCNQWEVNRFMMEMLKQRYPVV